MKNSNLMKKSSKLVKQSQRYKPPTFGYASSGFFKTQQENKARKKRMMFPTTKKGASDER